MRPPLLASIALAASFASAPAEAAEGPDDRDRALPCRPTIACTAEIVPPGTFEVEAGYIYRRLGPGSMQRSFPFLLKLTAARWLQVQIGSNGYTTADGDTPARFFDDVTVGLKFHVLDQAKVAPALAVSGTLSLPTPAGQPGYVHTYDALFTGYVTKDVGPLHGDLNFGANIWRLEDHPLPQAFAALALSADLVAPFGVMAEGYVFSSAAPVAQRDGGFLFAFTHAPKRWLMFDLGGDIGFFPATRAYSVFLGLTVIPAVFWR